MVSPSLAQRLYKSSLERTLLELQDKMMFTGHFGDQKAVEKIIILLSDLYVEDQEKNSKEKKEKEKKTESYAQVYKLPGLMAEAILLVDGTPLWLVTEEPGLVTVAEYIDISETEILKPFPRSSYINRPYEFKTLDEVKERNTSL